MRTVLSIARLSQAAAALVTVLAPHLAQSGRLFPGEQIPVGVGPTAVAVGALDAGDSPDAVVANQGGQSLSILLGDGAGAFASIAAVALGFGPSDVDLADLDGDGDEDAVAADRLGGRIAVLLGDGAGSLAAPTPYAAGATAVGLALGDVDGDGDADAIVAGGFDDVFTRLLGDGAGGFGAPVAFAASGLPTAIALGDLDRDGDLDLALARKGDSLVTAWLGNGLGAFAEGSSVGVGEFPIALAAGDVNEDAWLDLAVGTESIWVPGPAVLLGGPAGFAPAPAAPIVGASSVALADVDGDAHLDLAYVPVVGPGGYFDALLVRLGDGTGAFAAGAKHALDAGVRDVALADFDQDGSLDALAASASSDAVSLLLGNGLGGFEVPVPGKVAPAPLQTHAIAARALDADSDGVLDLALLDTTFTGPSGGDGVALALGDGKGGFATPSSFHALGLWVGGLAAGDFDQDGDTDVVAGRYLHQTIPVELTVFLSDGAGSLAPQAPIAGALGGAPAMEVADLDHDGDLDLVTGDADLAAGSTPIAVLHGDGAGSFGPAVVAAQVSSALQLDAGDLDGDGTADFAAADFYGASAHVLLGDGAGGLQAPTRVATGTRTRSVVLADVDGDGKRDLVAGGDPLAFGGTSMTFHKGDGTGGLGAGTPLLAGVASKSLIAADLDSDGRRDVAAVHPSSGASFSVFPADGAGGFAPRRTFIADLSPEALLAADFDADGRVDALCTQRSGSEYWLYRNERPYPEGLMPYGAGTSGCGGGHGSNANGSPSVGNASFALASTNAPENGIGLRVLSLAPDFAGSDPFGLGFLLHVDPIAGGAFLALNFASDELGQGKAPLPIPSDPALAGSTAFLQALWLWTGPCQPSAPLGLSSSAGLRLTVQP